MKEMKYIRLIVFSLFIFVLTIVLIAMLISGYNSGEIFGVGKGNHRTYTLEESPQGYWSNLIVWAGLIIFIILVSIREVVRSIKEIKNS